MNNMNKKKTMLLTLISILTLTLITLGVSLAFFNYMKKGTTENSVKTGTITFLYTEVDAKGAGISIEDALPMTDEQGKAQTGNGNVFNFKVTSTTTKDVSIPYEVTARQSKDSTLDNKMVRIYLTEVDGNTEKQLLLDNYNNLNQTSQSLVKAGVIEKTIYTDTVPASSTNYEKNFRLRMWVDENTDFSPVKDDNGNDTYPYNGKTFTITVNVYSNGKVVVAPTSRKLGEAIKEDNTLITTTPDLTKTVTAAGETAGLYSSTDTNSGDATYYFRGNVANNNVKFAGLDWKVVRVNEDGTVKLVLKDTVNTNNKYFTNAYNSELSSYYSNSNLKALADEWYKTNISEYGKYVAYENYCEQARVVQYSSNLTDVKASMKVKDEYTPTFKCETDTNGYGNVYTKIALLTYDEMVYAGSASTGGMTDNYLSNESSYWTMSPAGYNWGGHVWISYTNYFSTSSTNTYYALRPVISLTSETKATGTGTEQDPYIVVIDSGDQSDNGALYVSSGSSLNTEIMKKPIITTSPTLTATSITNKENGLYQSTDTNSGNVTYYFRGTTLNNYVKFADRLWRIIRINEDGTVRMITNNLIDSDSTIKSSFKKYSANLTPSDMYYSGSDIKNTIDNWYTTNLQAYDSKIATSSYCEQAKAAKESRYVDGSETNMTLYSSYTPNFKCTNDTAGHGELNLKIGLINYDELIYAGNYYTNGTSNYDTYLSTKYDCELCSQNTFWTMSPSGSYKGSSNNSTYYFPALWTLDYAGIVNSSTVEIELGIRPVINLNKDTVVTGTGTYSDPYIVK